MERPNEEVLEQLREHLTSERDDDRIEMLDALHAQWRATDAFTLNPDNRYAEGESAIALLRAQRALENAECSEEAWRTFTQGSLRDRFMGVTLNLNKVDFESALGRWVQDLTREIYEQRGRDDE